MPKRTSATGGLPALSRRERQVMDIIYRLESATAAEILSELPDPPSDSAIRYVLRTLGTKGHVTHAWDGPRYTYRPTAPRAQVRKAQVRQMIETFFDGKPERLMASLLEERDRSLDREALDRIARMIDAARRTDRSR